MLRALVELVNALNGFRPLGRSGYRTLPAFWFGWHQLDHELYPLVVGTLLSRLMEGMFGQYWIEGLVILGWVALWRPMEIFLYDWWPLLKERNLYRDLDTATVLVKAVDDRPA